jgi:teichuronic acid exporter
LSYVSATSSLHARALDSFYWLAGGRFTAQLLSWILTLWVIRLLSPRDYGLAAMAGIFVSTCALLEDLGLGTAITRAPTLDEGLIRKALAVVMTVNALFCGGLWLAAPGIAWFYTVPEVAPIVRMLALGLFISAFAVIPRALLERALRFRQLGVVELLAPLFGAATTLALALCDYGVWALVIGTLTTTIVRTALLNVLSPFRGLPRWSLDGMRALLTFGGTLSLERIVWYVYSQADVFIASSLLGPQAVGFYVVGKQIAALPSQKISPIVQQIAVPVFARMQDDGRRVSRGLLETTGAVALFVGPVAFGLAAVGADAIALVLGPHWSPAVVALQGYGVIVPLGMISAIVLSALKAVGRPDLSLRNVASGCAVMIAAFAVGSRWGVAGLSLAWVVAYPLYFVGTVVRSAPVLGTTPRALFGRVVGPLVASAVMFAVVTAAGTVTGHLVAGGLGRLLVLVAVGALVYGAIVASLFRRSLMDAVSLVGRKWPSSQHQTV